MELSSDSQKLFKDLKSGKKIVAMLAPSYVVDFKYPDIIVMLRMMGFDKVVELTFGAKIINKFYHKIIETHKNRMFISTACPVVAMLVKSKYPKYASNLIPVVSPVGATARIMRKNYPKHKLVFIAPCFAKKTEVKEYGNLVTNSVTYAELQQLIEHFEANNLFKKIKNPSRSFDKFYNDYTKIYPLSGGLSSTMHAKKILKKDEVIVLEGPAEIGELLKKGIPKKVRFADLLYCFGGCIGGPGVISKEPIKIRHKKVMDYLEIAKHESMGKNIGLIKYVKGISFCTPKKYIDDKYWAPIKNLEKKLF